MVEKAIAEQGRHSFRFDTDRFPTETLLEVYHGRGSERKFLVSDQGTLDLNFDPPRWNYKPIKVEGQLAIPQ